MPHYQDPTDVLAMNIAASLLPVRGVDQVPMNPRFAALSEAILKEPYVLAVTGLSASSMRRRVKEGTFPAPIKLGAVGSSAASGWLASEIAEWISSLKRDRDAK